MNCVYLLHFGPLINTSATLGEVRVHTAVLECSPKNAIKVLRNGFTELRRCISR